MRVYIEITGYIKNHQNFKILFWSRESEKPIFRIFPEFFTKKWPETRESRVRRPGNLENRIFSGNRKFPEIAISGTLYVAQMMRWNRLRNLST